MANNRVGHSLCHQRTAGYGANTKTLSIITPPIPVPFGIENPSESDAVLRIQFVGDPDGAYSEIVGATWLNMMPR